MNRNNLPLFKAIFDPDDLDEGVFTVSLVEEPAVESYFIAFDKDEELSFSIVDEFAHKVIGVVLRADYPILRVDGEGKYYNLVFDKDTIYNITQRFVRSGFTGSVSVLHNGVPVDGVDLTQLFIKDESKGISPKGFESIEDGSLFAEYKVNNSDIWEKIISGELKGFSVEGVFGVKETPNQTNKPNETNKFNLINMNKLRDKLAKLLLKFDSVSTDKADLFYDHEGELVVGDEVYTYDANGDRASVEDGDYESDGYVYVIKEGKVEEIREKETAKDDSADPAAKEDVAAEEVEIEVPSTPDPAVAAGPEDVITPAIEALAKKIAGLEERLAALEEKVKEPVAAPIVEEFNKINLRTGDNRADRLAAIGAALK